MYFINDNSFSGCSGFDGILTIPGDVISISMNAFYGCSNFSYAQIEKTSPPSIGSNAFGKTTFEIRVPAESVDKYKAASGWETYASRIVAIPE